MRFGWSVCYVCVGTVVTALFWGLYAIDRELIFPKRLDAIYPPMLNHVQHTTILVFAVAELLLQRPPRRSLMRERAALLTVNVAYIAWIVYLYQTTGVWVYPILAVLPLVGKVVFIAFSALLSLSVHTLVWLLVRRRMEGVAPAAATARKFRSD